MKSSVPYAALAVALTMTACSGSATNVGVPAASATATAAAAANAPTASLSLTIPRSAADAARLRKSGRTRHYVSYGTLGISVAVYQTDTDPASAVVTDYDVSPSSSLCAAASGTGGQQCTIAVPAPPGNDSFIVNAYATTPSQGFAAAGRLATGTTSATIVSGQTNAISAVLAEIVSSVVFSAPRLIELGNQQSSTPLSIAILDASGNSQADEDTTPFALPIHLASTEFANGNGQLVHTTFSINGGFPVGFVTLAKPSDADAVTINYDGQAPLGYYAIIDATIPDASSEFVGSGEVDPLFFTSSSPLYNGSVNFTAAGQSATIAIDLPDIADAAFPITITSSDFSSTPCTSIASVSAPTSGATPTVTISALGADGSCAIFIRFAQQFSVGGGETIGINDDVSIPVSSSI